MPAIYISYPGSDDRAGWDARERLVDQLSQSDGVQIYPETPPDKITDAEIADLLRRSDCSLHFLCVTPGRLNEEGKGLAQRQFELAEEEERGRSKSDYPSREAGIFYVKSRILAEVEELSFEPEEWDLPGGAMEGIVPTKELRFHLHFVCRVIKQRPPVRVFYSYARKDKMHLQELRKSLVTSRRNGSVLEWHDGLLQPGEDWNQETADALKDCDALVYLVTPDAIASSYAYLKEYRVAKRLGKKVVPVAVVPAILEDTDLNESQMIPLDSHRLKPVEEWDSPSKAWKEVASQLRQTFSSLSDSIRRESASVRIAPCSDLAEFKEIVSRRFELHKSKPRDLIPEALGPMIFLDWVKQPEPEDHEFRKIKEELVKRGRITAKQPQRPFSAEAMYGCSDAVVLYCRDREEETATQLQQWLWRVERRRRSRSDLPKCILVLDRYKGRKGLTKKQFADYLPQGGSVVVVQEQQRKLESLLTPLWERIAV